ncbi:MAG: ribonuclease G [Dethiobacteria bacterium]|nr:ribonuclease G [Dethiobacteria bacterium]
MGWIWGLGNKTYIALLGLIPGVNLVMAFVLGAKGNQWAWNNRNWEGMDQFKQVQKIWSTFGAGMIVGFLLGVIAVLLVVVHIVMSVFL